MILQVENAGNVWEGNHTLPKFKSELTPEKWWLGNYTFLFGFVTSGAMLATGVYGWDLESQDYKYLFNLKLLISTKFPGGYTVYLIFKTYVTLTWIPYIPWIILWNCENIIFWGQGKSRKLEIHHVNLQFGQFLKNGNAVDPWDKTWEIRPS